MPRSKLNTAFNQRTGQQRNCQLSTGESRKVCVVVRGRRQNRSLARTMSDGLLQLHQAPAQEHQQSPIKGSNVRALEETSRFAWGRQPTFKELHQHLLERVWVIWVCFPTVKLADGSREAAVGITDAPGRRPPGKRFKDSPGHCRCSPPPPSKHEKPNTRHGTIADFEHNLRCKMPLCNVRPTRDS